jgi:hypothetical protein
MMKSSVIENHHLIGLKLRHEAGFEPCFKHSTMTIPFDGERGLELVLTVRCNQIVTQSLPLQES